jgi:hypothetical protein
MSSAPRAIVRCVQSFSRLVARCSSSWCRTATLNAGCWLQESLDSRHRCLRGFQQTHSNSAWAGPHSWTSGTPTVANKVDLYFLAAQQGHA